jgi:hypothetical protein
VKGQPVPWLRRLIFVCLLFVKAALAVVIVAEKVAEDPNADIKQAWSLLHDDTQPIPIVRSTA